MPFFVVWVLIDRLQAIVRAFAMLCAWAPTHQEDVSQVLKDRFSLFSHCLQDVFFGVAAAADARGPNACHRQRLVHKLLLDYAREQAHQRNPLLFH